MEIEKKNHMYCNQCGKEISDDALFCPKCGKEVIITVDTANAKTNSDNAISEPAKSKTDIKNQKMKSKVVLGVVSVLILITVVGYFSMQYVIKSTIEEKTAQYMDTIKNGPDEETVDMILESVLPNLVDDGSSFSAMLLREVSKHVSGEDVLDIYLPLMHYMDYEILDVKKIGSKQYSVTIHIFNLNNKYVALRAADLYKSKYSNGLTLSNVFQFVDDVRSDKSQLISQLLYKAGEELYHEGDSQYRVQSEYTILIEKNGKQWNIVADYLDVIKACYGLK